MARQQAVFLTGDKKVDRALRRLGGKQAERMLIKGAKAAGKVVRRDARNRTPQDTGAMRDAYQVLVKKEKHKESFGALLTGVNKATGFEYVYRRKRIIAQDIGARVVITAARLAKLALGRGKRATSTNIKTRKQGVFFYPSQIELGNHKRNGQRPLTKALYENRSAVLAEFKRAMRQLLRIATKGAGAGGGIPGAPEGSYFDAGGRLRDAQGRFI